MLHEAAVKVAEVWLGGWRYEICHLPFCEDPCMAVQKHLWVAPKSSPL